VATCVARTAVLRVVRVGTRRHCARGIATLRDATASGALKLSALVVFVCLALGLYAAATDLAIVWRWLLGVLAR
jgi:hypothetical protein